jgi:hypothetical protein
MKLNGPEATQKGVPGPFLFQYLKPDPLGQVRDIRLGHKQMPGMLEQWKIGILGSMVGVLLLLNGLCSEKNLMLYITQYSITPILHRLLLR